MPLVLVQKARRKPEWQDKRPDEQGLRDTYSIAGRHVQRWSRAFLKAIREMAKPENLKEARRKYVDGRSAEEIINALPWPNLADPDEQWQRTLDNLNQAYVSVLDDAQALPVRVEKAEVGVVVPINPFSIKWAREQGSKLVAEVFDATKKALRNTVFRAMEQGLRADAMVDEIRNSVGLLEREERAVANRAALLRKQGVAEPQIRKLSRSYASKLLTKRAQRIARTETIAAQNRGLVDKWQQAKEEGKLPAVERVWVASPSSPRTCPICLELNGKTAPLNEPYYSAVLGTHIDNPPAHPHCRCAQVLRRIKER